MLLTVTNLQKSYSGAEGSVPVLRGIDMQVAAGETVALTGESGSGKSTLLHLIGGLDTPDAGAIVLDDQDIGDMSDSARAAIRCRSLGIIFQQFNLIPSLDVAANIAFQARLAGSYDAAGALELADALGLADHLAKYPEQLSGGQQQRVAIARALAAKPKIILADEPTGNLDEATAADVMTQMLTLVTQTGAALVMVTHSPRLAGRMARQLHLARGQLA